MFEKVELKNKVVTVNDIMRVPMELVETLGFDTDYISVYENIIRASQHVGIQVQFPDVSNLEAANRELDEFDKIYGTIPPNKENAAQMLFVEADADMRVRIYPYDVITSNFFPMTTHPNCLQ